MSCDIHGLECVHQNVVNSMSEPGKLHHQHGKLEEAVRTYEMSMEMKRAIYGEESKHTQIEITLYNLELVH